MNLTRFAWRQVWRGALIWAAVAAIVVASGIAAFESAYPTAVSREAFARSIARLPAFQALYGRTIGVDTVGGFVTWRYGDLMTVVVGLWALLAATRILRGDEETGRAESLLGGAASPRRVLLTELCVVGAGCGLVFLAVALAAGVGGLPLGGSLLFGSLVATGGVVFGAVAAVTSQLVDTRRRAAGWAGAVLGASYLLRALADGSSDLHWLGWLTPLGWAERIEPFTGPSLVPIAAVAALSAVLVGAAAFLRERRDTGAGLLGARQHRRRVRPIRSTLALDWSLSTGALVAWSSGVAIAMFVMGYLTRDIVRFAHDNPAIEDQITKIYGYSMNSAVGFLSLAFGVVALVLAVFAGAQMVSAREEEAAGRTDTVVVAGTSRARWLVARIAVALVAIAALALVAALGAWAGANVSGASVGFVDAVEASFNVVPAALLFGGLAVLAFGALPRATTYVAFGAAAVAYLIQVVAGLSGAPGWLIDLSPFSHLAPVPATPVNTGAMLVMLAVALAASALGLAAFRRRDLASG
ncbi:MAG TPA: hypothetical protein VEP49_00150 [Acidimicrobiia bacterium]|nr:hypothetical protein [Acidimicrobiia bacterium]